MEADLADRHHRSAVLTKERDEQAAQLRSLQAALADARARVLEVDRKRDSLPRYACGTINTAEYTVQQYY